MKQTIHPSSGYLEVVASGQFSLERSKDAFMEILDALVKNRLEKVLLDGRDLTGQPETIERFYYGEFAATNTVEVFKRDNLRPKFAYVLKHPMLDPSRLGETVAVNRGMNVRAFEDLNEAHAWLMGSAIK